MKTGRKWSSGRVVEWSSGQQLNRRTGGTLVEVMMACVVLMVIAITGGSYVAQSSGTLALHRNRAVALAVANSQMEVLRAQGYSSLSQQMVVASTIGTNNSRVTLQYWPVPELVSGTGHEAIQITVQVTNQAPDCVSLVTTLSP